MKFTVSNGLNVISVGSAGLGTYFRLRYPAAVVWNDCAGSVGQYLCLLPVAEKDRLLLQEKVNGSLFSDYTGRDEELKELLDPLIGLLADGEYQLGFNNRVLPETATIYSGGGTAREYEPSWYVQYGEMVQLDAIPEKIQEHKSYIKSNNLQGYSLGIIDSTTSQFYDWENHVCIATKPKDTIDPARVGHFEALIREGQRPFAILISCSFSEEDNDYYQSYVLDGHHKLQAYQNLDIKPPFAAITRMVTATDEIEYDMESLAKRMYPWQVEHILKNTIDNERLKPLLQNPDSVLHRFLRNGLYEEHHDNGKLRHSGHYILNKPNGTIREWYENGQLKYEKNYTAGKFSGTWQEWFENGNLSSLYSFDDNGRRHGTGKAYFESGEAKSYNEYNHGLPADGYSFSKYNHTGKMNYELWHEGGIMVRKKTYADNGSLISTEEYSAPLQKLVVVPERNDYTKEPVPFQKPKTGKMSLVAQLLWTALLLTLTVIAGEIWKQCSGR